jgi:hypothetical protein
MNEERSKICEIIRKNEKKFNQMFYMEFWRCEYTKRKYILDIQKKIFPSKYEKFYGSGSELIDRALSYVIYHSDNIFGINKNSRVNIEKLYDFLKKIIISYHNYFYKMNPKYYYDDSFVFPINFDDFYESLSISQKDSLKALHNDSITYGFYPEDMTTMRHLDKLEGYINRYFKENGVYPKLQDSFLIVKEQDPDFFYKDLHGKRFFVDEEAGETIYVYVQFLNEKRSLSKIVTTTIGLINSALKRKPIHAAGDRNKADIQICIYNKKIIKNDDFKDILMNNFASCRNYYYPEKFAYTTDTINMATDLIVPEYEQVPFSNRAAGLWIWDQVCLYNNKLSNASRQAREIEAFKLYDSIDDSSVWRMYKLAKMSIKNMEVLKFSDLKEK